MTNAQSSLLRSALIHRTAALCPPLPPSSPHTHVFNKDSLYEWTEQTSQRSLHGCAIKASHSVPMVSSWTFAAFHCWRTQNAVLSAGALVGWHWEHLWLKGKRTAVGGRGGQRTQIRVTQTLHCALPRQMEKAKYAACFLVNQPMKLNVVGRSTERPTGRR